ncbi:hypothetical protein, partial [Tenacibaculum geojense]
VAGEYVNNAAITDSDQFDPDSDPNSDATVDDNGDGITDDDEASFVIVPKSADLALTKNYVDDNGGSLNVGDVLTFSLGLTNGGADAATGVSVSDVLPVGFSIVPGSISNSGVYNAGATTINWSGLSVPLAGITLTYQVIVNAPTGAANEYVNNAAITGSDQFDPDSDPSSDATVDDYGDGISDDDEASATVVPTASDLSLVKGVQNSGVVLPPNVGDVLTFELVLANAGPDAATRVSISDMVPVGYSGITNISNGGLLTGNTITWNSLSVASGGTLT